MGTNMDRIDSVARAQLDRVWDELFYEEGILKYVCTIAGRFLPISRVRVAKGTGHDSQFLDLLENAEDNGNITDDQFRQVLCLDIVLTARRNGDGANVYAAVDVAVAICDRNIARAATGARALADATGQVVLPAVIGVNINDTAAELASADDVTIILAPEGRKEIRDFVASTGPTE
jgi:hypothetical protein